MNWELLTIILEIAGGAAAAIAKYKKIKSKQELNNIRRVKNLDNRIKGIIKMVIPVCREILNALEKVTNEDGGDEGKKNENT